MWGWRDKAEYVWKRNRPLMLTARHIMILKCDPRNAPAEQYHCITEKIRIKGKLWSTLAKTQNCLGGWGGHCIQHQFPKTATPTLHPAYWRTTPTNDTAWLHRKPTPKESLRSQTNGKPRYPTPGIWRKQWIRSVCSFMETKNWITGIKKKNKKKTTRRKKGAAFKTEMCPLGHDRKKIKRLKI